METFYLVCSLFYSRPTDWMRMLPLCSVVCSGGPERRIFFPLVRSGFDCQIMTSANKLWLKHLQLPQTAAAPPACALSAVNIRSSGRFKPHCFDARLLCLFVCLCICKYSQYFSSTCLYFTAKKKVIFENLVGLLRYGIKWFIQKY